MLKLMYDGREFRTAAGGTVDLSKAGITGVRCREVMLTGIDVATFSACYTGKVEVLDYELEFELWRNSFRYSGLYALGQLGRLHLLIEGKKVNIFVVHPQDADEVEGYNQFRITFTVPMYKENQCI